MALKGLHGDASRPGSIRLCWGCDNQLREQTTERLAGIAMQNLVKWLLERVNIMLGFSADHTLTLPEFCWWMVRNDLADLIPESVASKALRIKPESHSSDAGKRHCSVITGN
jgi:hypothetical protein